jgi:heme-degrading monooxygenase HmoA
MYIAMNRFRVSRGREEEFVEIWRNRESYLDEVEGIKDFQLLRGEAEEDATVFVSHSVWDSREAFRAWTESEAFVKAHRQAKMPQGVLLGHPGFEGYEIVDLSKS